MKKQKLVGWALWRKCCTYREWSIDNIRIEDEGKRELIREMKKNRKEDWSELIELKQKISKVDVFVGGR